MTTHSSILAWETPWTEEPDGLWIMELQKVGHDLATKQQSCYLNGDKTCTHILKYILKIKPSTKNPEIHHFTHWLQSILNQILFQFH